MKEKNLEVKIMGDNLFLTGNELLLIFKRYLEEIELSKSRFIDDLLYELIGKNAESYIEYVEKNNIKLPDFSSITPVYLKVKELYLEAKVKGKPLKLDSKNF